MIILRDGKMSNKYKYLEYATKMMYIPRLHQEEYALIHHFRKNDVCLYKSYNFEISPKMLLLNAKMRFWFLFTSFLK